MKKILTIVFALHKGGTERAAQNFVEAYHKLGHDSRVLVTEGLGTRAIELESLGIKIYEHHNSNDIDNIISWSPDVIHLHSNGLDYIKIRLLMDKIKCKPKVIETNVFSMPSPYEQYLDLSFQLSQWCNWIYNKHPHKCKSIILPNPVNINNFYRTDNNIINEFRSTHNIKPSEIVIGRVGQNCISKWSYLLVDVFASLCSTHANIKLLMVNPPDEILKQISRQSIAVQDKIVVIDQILGDEALIQCYSAIDVFMHIADQGESFGLVLAEAMLCEVPVITYSTPWGDNSQCEVVGNGIGGYVVTNYKDLRSSVEALIVNPNLRKLLGKSARARILDRYSSISVAQKALALIDKSETNTSATTNVSICKTYKDVYGRFSKAVYILLLITPKQYMFKLIRIQILLLSNYGIFYYLNPRFWKKMCRIYLKTAI